MKLWDWLTKKTPGPVKPTATTGLVGATAGLAVPHHHHNHHVVTARPSLHLVPRPTMAPAPEEE